MKKIICALFILTTTNLFSQNTNISEGDVFDGEPFLITNPANPEQITVAWMGFNGLDLIQIQTRVSLDGGMHWESTVGIPHQEFGNVSADPSMAYNSDGALFICYIDYDPYYTSGGVYIRKSTDHGISWGAPVKAIDAFDDGFEFPVDRPWITIDQSGGIYDGYIYITTKPAPFIPIPNKNYLVISNDGGASFSDWKNLDAAGWQIGDFIQAPMATPVISADGKFHCVYPAWEITENLLPRFIHASSSDGGANFTYHEMIESGGGDLITDTLPKVGYLLIADPTDPDHLVFSFVLQSLGDADIFILESTNSGASWSDKIRVNDDAVNAGIMQDMVWADFNDNGDLLVSWRDRRNAPDTGYATSSEFWAAVKWKDSTAFSSNFKLSDQLVAFDDVLKENGNDFMGCAFIGDTAIAVWGELRELTLNIWFAKRSAKTTAGTSVVQIGSSAQSLLRVFPNPAGDKIYFTEPPTGLTEIYNAHGEIVLSEKIIEANTLHISGLSPGIYYLSCETKNGKQIAGFVKK